MGFQEALKVGKKYLRVPKTHKGSIRYQHPPSKDLKPEGFTDHPGGGLYPIAKDSSLPMPRGEVSPIPEKANRSAFPRVSTDQKLLNSFPRRKNAELREYSRGSEVPKPDHGAEDQIAVVFSLTRTLLAKTAAPLDARLIRNDDWLERALGKIHPRLPISIRLILWKKRYIQFMLNNRERLIR